MKNLLVALLSLSVTACGGAPFVFVPTVVTDAGFSIDAGSNADDAAPEAADAGKLAISQAVDASPDSEIADADASALEADASATSLKDATADVVDAAVNDSFTPVSDVQYSTDVACTPSTASYLCGTNSAIVTAPIEYCSATTSGATVSGQAMPAPHCMCARTCACLLANAYLGNPNSLCASGSFQRCTEAPLTVFCQ